MKPIDCCRLPNGRPGARTSTGCYLKFSMKSGLRYGSILLLLMVGLDAPADPRTDEEQQLIRVLQSNAAPAQKDAACARLKFIGTAQCVSALAPLLLDDQLSHSARYVLESMHLAEADDALLNALDKTRGATKIGIINSLGFRGEPRAVPALALLARGSDIPMAFCAARALGQIGGAEAIKDLQSLVKVSSGP